MVLRSGLSISRHVQIGIVAYHTDTLDGRFILPGTCIRMRIAPDPAERNLGEGQCACITLDMVNGHTRVHAACRDFYCPPRPMQLCCCVIL